MSTTSGSSSSNSKNNNTTSGTRTGITMSHSYNASLQRQYQRLQMKQRRLQKGQSFGYLKLFCRRLCDRFGCCCNCCRRRSSMSGTGSSRRSGSGCCCYHRRRAVVVCCCFCLLAVILWLRHVNPSRSTVQSSTTAIYNKRQHNSKNQRNHISPAIVVSDTTNAKQALQTMQGLKTKETMPGTITSAKTIVAATSKRQTTNPVTAQQRQQQKPQQAFLPSPHVDQHPKVDDEEEGKSVINKNEEEEEESDDMPSWMADYIDFVHSHITKSTTLRGKTKYTIRSSNNDEDDAPTTYLQWTCDGRSCGGLGDRINGMIQTLFMAMCRQSIFVIDWRGPGDLTDYLRPNKLPWHMDRLSSPPDGRIDTMDNRNTTYLLEPDELPQKKNLQIKANLWMGEKFLHSQCWTRYAEKYPALQQHRQQEDEQASSDLSSRMYQTAFAMLFQWSPKVQQYSQTLQERAGIKKPYLAMHIRTGKLPNDMVRDDVQLEDFQMCAQLFHKYCPNLDLYLATDYKDIKEQEFTVTIKTVRGLTIAHLDKAVVDHVDMNGNEEAELAVFAELVLLRDAECLMMSRSKYSRLAAALSPTQCAIYADECIDDESRVQSLLQNRMGCSSLSS